MTARMVLRLVETNCVCHMNQPHELQRVLLMPAKMVHIGKLHCTNSFGASEFAGPLATYLEPIGDHPVLSGSALTTEPNADSVGAMPTA